MLELVVGPMFAGKSSYLARLYERLIGAGYRTLAVTSPLDDRPAKRHDGGSYPPVVPLAADPVAQCAGFQCVLFDEVQFYPETFPEALQAILASGTTVSAAGLDMTAENGTWEVVEQILPMAGRVITLRSRCACGAPAPYTQRLGAYANTVRVGGAEAYAPVCGACWQPYGP